MARAWCIRVVDPTWQTGSSPSTYIVCWEVPGAVPSCQGESVVPSVTVAPI